MPIELETTALGYKIATLISCISGDNHIKPYTLSSFRLIHQMANLLQFEREDNKMNNYQNHEVIIEELFVFFRRNLKRQITKELSYWSEYNHTKLLNKYESSEE